MVITFCEACSCQRRSRQMKKKRTGVEKNKIIIIIDVGNVACQKMEISF